MAYQFPAFWFYHAARAAQNATCIPVSPDSSTYSLFDDRQGEVFAFESESGTSAFMYTDRQLTPEADAVDTVIISGHNWNTFDILVLGVDSSNTGDTIEMLAQNEVTEANGVPIFRTLTPRDTTTYDRVQVQVVTPDGGPPFPELTEMYLTTKHEMARGPEPNWQHPWARTQRQFLSDAGVSSTWATGPNRKRYRLTWRHLYGPDRQIFLDMREQTDGWSRPFWMRPPDSAYPDLLVELDRDSDWVQDFANPLESGTSDRITLPLIEVLG